jgi:hypothetical protein
MALTASTLIDAALSRTYGHGSMGRQKVSKAMLLSELSYQDSLIVQMFSQIAPDLLATVTGTITITDLGNTNGYFLQNGIHYRDFTHIDTTLDKYVPINMIQRQHRQSNPNAPAGMLRLGATSGVFHPIDPEGKRFNGTATKNYYNADQGHTVSYSYVPLPAALTSVNDTLSAPDMAREAIVSSLELQILLASPQPNELRVQMAMAKRQGAMDALRMQAYKFMHPQGQPGGAKTRHRTAWIESQIG